MLETLLSGGADDVEGELRRLALRLGLVLAPAHYQLPLDASGSAGVAAGALRIEAGEGPFFCTSVNFSNADIVTPTNDDWELELQAGSRRITEGRCLGYHALQTLPIAVARMYSLPGPIVVERAESLRAVVTAASGGAVDANSVLKFLGFHVRDLKTRDRVVERGDEYARAVKKLIGEFFALGFFVASGGGVNEFAPAFPVRWDWAWFNADGTPTDQLLRLAGVDVTPNRMHLVPTLEFGMRLGFPTYAGDRVEYRVTGSSGITRMVLTGRAFRSA